MQKIETTESYTENVTDNGKSFFFFSHNFWYRQYCQGFCFSSYLLLISILLLCFLIKYSTDSPNIPKHIRLHYITLYITKMGICIFRTYISGFLQKKSSVLNVHKWQIWCEVSRTQLTSLQRNQEQKKNICNSQEA